MVEAVVAPDFYTIINKYLNKFAFGNADMSDLIALITEAIFFIFGPSQLFLEFQQQHHLRRFDIRRVFARFLDSTLLSYCDY